MKYRRSTSCITPILLCCKVYYL